MARHVLSRTEAEFVRLVEATYANRRREIDTALSEAYDMVGAEHGVTGGHFVAEGDKMVLVTDDPA